MDNNNLSPADAWQGLILFGLNTATYKMAFARCLLEFVRENRTVVTWHDLAQAFLKQYQWRLAESAMPQQGDATRRTVMERVVTELVAGRITAETAIKRVEERGLNNVVARFQNLGKNTSLFDQYFYEMDYGKKIILKDSLFGCAVNASAQMESELLARWSLLEGAFKIDIDNFGLANDVREIYLEKGYERTSLTSNIPFLESYQGGVCFYCAAPLGNDIHVDHVFPRQVVHHDEIWNLVLCHSHCNMLKSDRIVGPHFVRKLIARNENIMGSSHPWKAKIGSQLGGSPKKRSDEQKSHYDNVKKVLGSNYWGGADSYNPATDPFFRRLITVINNRPLS